MRVKKIYYKCHQCEEPYWVTPLIGSIKVECLHPCIKCGSQITVVFDQIEESSMQKEQE